MNNQINLNVYLQNDIYFKLENALKKCGFFDFKESTLFLAFSITETLLSVCVPFLVKVDCL